VVAVHIDHQWASGRLLVLHFNSHPETTMEVRPRIGPFLFSRQQYHSIIRDILAHMTGRTDTSMRVPCNEVWGLKRPYAIQRFADLAARRFRASLRSRSVTWEAGPLFGEEEYPSFWPRGRSLSARTIRAGRSSLLLNLLR
jgi:hypothetical protein